MKDPKYLVLMIILLSPVLNAVDTDGDGVADAEDSHPYNPHAWYEGQVIWFGKGSDSVRGGTVGKAFRSLSTSWDQGCGFTRDGDLLFWGENDRNQLSTIPEITKPITAFAGSRSYFVIEEGGAVKHWQPLFSSAMDAPGISSGCIDISLGFYHGMALFTDQSVTPWKANGLSIPADLGTLPQGLGGRASRIASGPMYNAAISTDNRLYVWGRFSLVTDPLSATTEISAGDEHVVVLHDGGSLQGWALADFAAPAVRFPENARKSIGVAAGDQFTVALFNNGSVGFYGEPNDLQSKTPPVDLRNVIQVVTTGDAWAAVIGGADSDGDGLDDDAEVNTYGSDPHSVHSDSDGIPDGVEVFDHGTNPTSVDSDDDSFNDRFEIESGFDPTDKASKPDALIEIRTAVEVSVYAALGKTYRLEYSDDLIEWGDSGIVIEGTGERIDHLESTRQKKHKYWRAIETP